MADLDLYTGAYTGQQIDDAIGRTAYTRAIGSTDSLANITAVGNYYWTTSPQGAPFGYGFMTVLVRGNTTIEQICYNTLGQLAIRQIYNGTVGDWIWTGAVMSNGVEIRTNDYFVANTKPVFVQTKSVGNVTADTVTTVTFISGLSTRGHILRCAVEGVVATNTNVMISTPFDDGSTVVKANGYYYQSSGLYSARIGIISNKNLTSVYATLWYTKE